MRDYFKWDTLDITSDAQLDNISEWMGLPKIQYIGFAEDMRKLPEGLSIINLGGHQGGTHWTMLWVDEASEMPESNGLSPNQVIYFDSYGVGPEDQIIKLAEGRDVIFNTKQVQRYEEAHCGIWVLLAAKAIVDAKKKGIDASEAINTFANEYKAV